MYCGRNDLLVVVSPSRAIAVAFSVRRYFLFFSVDQTESSQRVVFPLHSVSWQRVTFPEILGAPSGKAIR